MMRDTSLIIPRIAYVSNLLDQGGAIASTNGRINVANQEAKSFLKSLTFDVSLGPIDPSRKFARARAGVLEALV